MCLTCGAAWNIFDGKPFSFMEGDSWPASVQMQQGKCTCNQKLEERAKVLAVEAEGKYLFVQFEKCKLCGGLHGIRTGFNSDCCPHCNSCLSVRYKECGGLGFPVENIFFVFTRPTEHR